MYQIQVQIHPTHTSDLTPFESVNESWNKSMRSAFLISIRLHENNRDSHLASQNVKTVKYNEVIHVDSVKQ